MADTTAIRVEEARFARIDRHIREVVRSMLTESGVAVQDEGTIVSNRWRTLNFLGAGVAATDDPTSGRVNVTISGGGGGGGSGAVAVEYVLSELAADTTALSLWNGSSNDSPPANWETEAFDDSGWNVAVNNTEAAIYSDIIPGAVHLWHSATGIDGVDEQTLIRQRFVVPGDDVQAVSLTILCDSEMLGVWINGTFIDDHVATPWGDAPGDPALAFTFSVSTSEFNAAPAVNVIAVHAENNLDNTIGGAVIFRLGFTVGTAVGTVASDVTMTTQNTYYDGPQVDLAIGTWFLTGAVTCTDTSATANIVAKLWDGSTVESSGQDYVAAANAQVHICLSAIVTIITPTTYKISATNATRNTFGLIKAATPQASSGANASYLVAVRLG